MISVSKSILSGLLADSPLSKSFVTAPETSSRGETPRQTADGILDALGFVLGLADARGMFDVGDLILQAMENLDVWRSSKSPIVARRPQADAPLVKRQMISEPELDALLGALGGLCNEYRKPFVLKIVFQHSYEEVAQFCRVSVNTARFCVMRGFRHVLAAMKSNPGLRKKVIEIEASHNWTA